MEGIKAPRNLVYSKDGSLQFFRAHEEITGQQRHRLSSKQHGLFGKLKKRRLRANGGTSSFGGLRVKLACSGEESGERGREEMEASKRGGRVG